MPPCVCAALPSIVAIYIFSYYEQLKKWRCHFVRPSETLFFFSPEWTYVALKPYTALSNKTNKTNKTIKTNKTKEFTYPSQEGMFLYIDIETLVDK